MPVVKPCSVLEGFNLFLYVNKLKNLSTEVELLTSVH